MSKTYIEDKPYQQPGRLGQFLSGAGEPFNVAFWGLGSMVVAGEILTQYSELYANLPREQQYILLAKSMLGAFGIMPILANGVMRIAEYFEYTIRVDRYAIEMSHDRNAYYEFKYNLSMLVLNGFRIPDQYNKKEYLDGYDSIYD